MMTRHWCMCTASCVLAAECEASRLCGSHSAFKTVVQMLGNARVHGDPGRHCLWKSCRSYFHQDTQNVLTWASACMLKGAKSSACFRKKEPKPSSTYLLIHWLIKMLETHRMSCLLQRDKTCPSWSQLIMSLKVSTSSPRL